MPCLVVAVALFLPRLAIALLVLISDYIGRAFPGSDPFSQYVLPFLGFLFLPYTLLAYAWAQNNGAGISVLDRVVIVLAVLLDLGVIGGGAKSKRFRKRG